MMSMNKAQAGKKVVKKPVKKKAPHPNDDYKDMVDPYTGKKGTMGGEGTIPPFTRKEMEYKKKMTGLPRGKMGKTVSKAKNGKSFPDLNKDGKITKADILKGRGVIAKKGATVKKAQMGSFVTNEFAAKNRAFPANPKPKPTSNTKLLDSSIKKGKAINAYQGKKGMVAKSGASMKKCKYGCK